MRHLLTNMRAKVHGPGVAPASRRCTLSGSRPGLLTGFTLIELLVVVGIISLLVAIITPSLTTARREARKVACQSNLKQLVIGWHSYLDGNGGRFLRGENANVAYGGKQGAYPAYQRPKPLNKHLGMALEVKRGAEVYACPSDSGGGRDPNENNRSIRPTHYDYFGTSYFTNRLLVGPEDLPISPLETHPTVMREINLRTPSLSRSQLFNETRLLLIGDAGWDAEWNVASSDRIEWHGQRRTHNLGFMDGHAEFVRIRKGVHVTAQYTVIPFKDLMSQTTSRPEASGR